jgi:hypothetical protein
VSIDKYLYDIIEEYKEVGSEEEKSEIFKDFCSLLWKSKNKRRVFTRAVKYKVRSNLLESDVGQVFNSWSEIDYTSYKSMTKDTDWCSLIRQKINNLYTRYCDKEVILKKDYMDLLKTSKKMYYRWINGEEMNADVLTDLIDDSINKAIELKSVYQKQKMDISWSEYKKVVEGFLKNIFDRCKLADDYEAEQLSNEQINLTNKYIYDFYNEDKSYIKYICDSLEGEMLKWQKKYYGVKEHKQYKRCIECGSLIEKTNNRAKYCKDCAKIIDRNKAKIRMRNIRK